MRSASLALVGLALLAAPSRAEVTPPREGLELAFSDEFDGPEVDARWSTTLADGKRSLNGEMQTYRDRGDPSFPFRFSEGVLSIMASAVPGASPESYSSGLLSTYDSYAFRYGYAEIRARAPAGQGLWPAFWLFRRDALEPGAPYGEIDVLEILGGSPGKAYATLHTGPQWEGRAIKQAPSEADPPYSDGFHTFAVDWTEAETVFYVDGRETGRFPTPPEAKAPMYMMVNLAVGGPWGGPPVPSTRFPSAFEVDYVRVWREPGTPSR